MLAQASIHRRARRDAGRLGRPWMLAFASMTVVWLRQDAGCLAPPWMLAFASMTPVT